MSELAEKSMGQMTVRLSAEQLAEIDRLVVSRRKGGVSASRQTLVAYWIAEGLRQAKRVR